MSRRIEHKMGSGLVFCFYLDQRGQALLYKLRLYEERQKTRPEPKSKEVGLMNQTPTRYKKVACCTSSIIQ
ncbi:MAG: hypothetical protein Q6356_007840 [Candidatus Wukongarchaeota archaeon]|nr:hypothetical protein [Candidatus Wukongarchaeota archaeon]